MTQSENNSDQNSENNQPNNEHNEQPNWVGTRKDDPRGTAHSILDIQNMPEAGHASEMQHDREVRAKEARDRADAAESHISPLLIIGHICAWVGMVVCALLVIFAPHFSPVMLRIFHDGYGHVGFYTATQPVFLIVTALLALWIFAEIEVFLRSLPSQLVSTKSASSLQRIGWVSIVQSVIFLIRSIAYPQLESFVLFGLILFFGVLALLFSAIIRTRAERQNAQDLLSAPVTDMKA